MKTTVQTRISKEVNLFYYLGIVSVISLFINDSHEIISQKGLESISNKEEI